MLDDTIIAVSTPFGYGGLGVVRLSGKKSLFIAKRIFRPRKNKGLILPKRPVLGYLLNYDTKVFFEEAYLTFFPAPYTYTKEDIVEISCHGSPVILEEIVRLGIRAGARHARPGEFTLRAYLRGRIDVLQAEAINDIIYASTLSQAKISFSQLKGGLSQKIKAFRFQIIHLLSQIEARIEFPEEGLKITSKQVIKTIEKIIQLVKDLIQSYDLGKALGEGLSIAITGRTNVGKSTLFNSLLESERAIVTPYQGTTRDYLREKIKINDAVFNLVDMAGIETSVNPVEREGIKRSKKIAAESDGILLLLDVSRKESEEDIKLIHKFKKKNTLLLYNKIDIQQKMDRNKIEKMAKNLPSLNISALKRINLEKLKEMIYEQFVPDGKRNDDVILHLRQKLLLEDLLSSLKKGIQLLREDYPEEIYVEEIRKSLPLIGQLTGEIRTDEIIDEIFNRFCVGK